MKETLHIFSWNTQEGDVGRIRGRTTHCSWNAWSSWQGQSPVNISFSPSIAFHTSSTACSPFRQLTVPVSDDQISAAEQFFAEYGEMTPYPHQVTFKTGQGFLREFSFDKPRLSLRHFSVAEAC